MKAVLCKSHGMPDTLVVEDVPVARFERRAGTDIG